VFTGFVQARTRMLKRVAKALKKFNKRFLSPAARVVLYPVFGLMVGMMLRVVSMTLRVRIIGGERTDLDLMKNGERVVYAFWHGRQFALFHLLRKSRCAVLTSLSEAGEVQKWVLRSFGHTAVRGSSTRGAASGMVRMIKAVKAGRNAAFAVDGPRGPVFRAKPGAIQAAAKAGAWLVPVTVGFGKSWELKKVWDLYRFPRPFTVAAVSFGKPRSYPRSLSVDELDAEAEALTEELNELTRRVDAAAREGK